MSRFRVAAVLFENFEMLDLYGPLEMYCAHPEAFEIITIAERTGPVRAYGGPCTLAEDSFDNRAAYDILLVPGGSGTRQEVDNPAMLEWLRQAGPRAQLITSVCTGSSLLARAGLLGSGPATTNKAWFDEMAALAPDVDWRKRARWVESGKCFTSSGVSAGMDMTLAVIERLLGREAAEIAAQEAEYTRNPDPDNDPFAID
jgi:transcriptional regulator GlxA family with amidase domain